jgi:hypothetical protein
MYTSIEGEVEGSIIGEGSRANSRIVNVWFEDSKTLLNRTVAPSGQLDVEVEVEVEASAG